ncbi:MAG: hypothetical protein Tsb0010_11710 [Parvularculaceae bacterium]
MTRIKHMAIGAWLAAAISPAMAQPPEFQRGLPLEAMDLDRDERITREEVARFRAAIFEEMDADRDGALTPSEIEAAREARKRARRVRGFSRMDHDGDGVLTEAEFANARMPIFDRLDNNGDGVISAEELAERSREWPGRRH